MRRAGLYSAGGELGSLSHHSTFIPAPNLNPKHQLTTDAHMINTDGVEVVSEAL